MSDTPVIKTVIANFDNLDLQEAAEKVQLLSQRSKFAYVITPNMDHLSRLCERANQYLLPIYKDADLSLCDSRIVEKLLSTVGKPVKAVVPGSDLTQYLFQHTLTPQSRVLLFGCYEAGVELLRARFPQLTIHHLNPSMGFIDKPEEVEQAIQDIKAYQADYIFLAVGSPRQEVFAGYLKKSGLEKGGCLVCGGIY